MSFTRQKASEAINQTNRRNGESFAVMYDMRINGNSDSPKGALKLDKNGVPVISGKQEVAEEIFGRYEDVIFLGEFEECPILQFHQTSQGKDRILSNFSFEAAECPATEYYFSFTKEQRKKGGPCKIRNLNRCQIFPVLALRRQDDPNYTNRHAKINPVNWFEMNVTDYGNTKDTVYKDNWERLRFMNSKAPISEFVYRIFYPNRGEQEKQLIYFQPRKRITPEVLREELKFNHPLVDDWRDDEGFVFDEDYYQLIYGLAILRFRRWVDPESGEPFEYKDNAYEKAIEKYKQYKDTFPSPVEGGNTNDNDQEHEEDIPF